MTSYKQIKLGVEFTLVVSNAREQSFEVTNLNDESFDSLKCSIQNSTSWAPPQAFVTDKVCRIIKIKFLDNSIPMTTSLSLLVQGCVNQVTVIEEKKVLLDGAALKEGITQRASDTWTWLKKSCYFFVFASIFLWFVSGTTFGDWLLNIWANFNAAKVIQMSNEADTRIFTNRHHLYQTAAFLEKNAQYKRIFGSSGDLSKLYNVVGNGTFLTIKLIRDRDGNILYYDHGDASNYCRGIGGRLLEVDELVAYLAGRYLSVENMIWPIRLEETTAEWTSSNYSWDNYYVYVKRGNITANMKVHDYVSLRNGYFIKAIDDGYKFAFRCGFTEELYITDLDKL